MPGIPGFLEPFAGDEDENILRIANDCARQLGLKEIRMDRAVWARSIPSDQCIFSSHGIALPLGMRHALGPEEWKPMIVAALVYRKKMGGRDMITFGLGTMIPYVFLPMVPFFVPLVLFLNTSPWLAVVLTIAYTPLYAGIAKHGFTRLSPPLRAAMLKADMEASDFLGNDSLLKVLKRIDRFGLEDVEKAKRQTESANEKDRPNLTQRIQNLSTLG